MAVTNGWGKGVENNTIGWGKSADNATNGFGSVYASSAAGDTLLGSGGTFDPDAQVYFTAVEDAGGTLTDNVKAEFDAFVVREKAGGRWGNIKRLYPFMGGTIDAARVDVVTGIQATNSNFVDADADATIGLQGDGSTKSLRLTETTNLILPDSTDFQIGVFRIGAVEQPSSLSRLMGHFSSANSLGRLYLQKNQLQPQVFATDNVVAAGGVLSTDSSHIGASFSSSDLNVLLDGVVVNTNSTARSTPFSTDLMDLFALNINGTPSSFSSIKSGGMFIASGLSLTETQAFESSYKTFINNIQAYAAAQAYFTAVETAGGTLSDNVKSEFSAFVSREVVAGRWSKIKRLYPFLGGVIDSARVDAINLGQATNTNFVDADVDATIGLQGDGSTKYLTDVSTYSSIVSSQYKVQQGAIYIGATGETSIPYLFGAINSGNYIASRYFSSSLIRSYLGLSSPYSQYAATIPTSASVVAARYSTTSAYTIVNNNTDLQDTSSTTYSFPAVAPSYFKANGAGGISNGKYSCHFISEFDTLQETKDFTTSYKTFINNIQAYAALMDSYSGAAVAYSLRKVYSTYEGSAINVRRSSDNATQDIGFDGYVLDEAALLSFVGASDGYVTTWYDQSGNGNDATQSTASNQPQIVSSGSTITFNGKSGVDFGAGDLLTCTLSTAITQPSTYYTVFENAQAAGTQRHYVEISDPNYVIGKSVLDKPFQYAGTFLYGATTLTTGAQYLQSGLFNTSSSILRLNGAQDASGNNGALTSATAMSIGGNASNPIIGIIQEYIAYNTDESSEFSNVESKINTYYNIY